MRQKFWELVKKHGMGIVIGSATLDGYRRQYVNDNNNNILEKIKEQRHKLKEDEQREYDRLIEEQANKIKNKETIGKYQDAADEHEKAVDKYQIDPSESNKNNRDKSLEKMNEAFDEIKKLDISEYIVQIYNYYSDYLDSLNPDKIVCLFNIIADGLMLSSFVTVLNIMLSENIINKITFLEKYPRILKWIKFKNNFNKKVIKFYLILHLIYILSGILCNIYIFIL